MQLQPPHRADMPAETALLTPYEFKALAVRVRQEAARIRSSRRLALAITTVPTALVSLWWLWSGSAASVVSTVMLLFLYAHTNHLISLRLRANEAEVRRLAGLVHATQDVRQLGTILDLQEVVRCPGVAWFELYTAAYHALPRLLPLVQSHHAETLTTQQRARLCGPLFHQSGMAGTGAWRGPLYCMDVLSALEQIGDKRDLPDVERLLKEDALADDIRAAAERCAQVIRERITREAGKDFLLRADRKPEAIATLLRPAAENGDTVPQQLLRATTYNDGETPA